MSGHESGEYDLAELPEPEQPRTPVTPATPLPRMWKTEPEEEEPDTGTSKASKARAPASSQPHGTAGSKARASSSKARPGKKPAVEEGTEKKVLIEETPALDTYEARQRARLIIGGLITSCILIFGWIVYRLFLHDPGAIDIPADDSNMALSAPEPKPDRDIEARSMLNRARDNAKAGRTKEAIALLENVVKVYRGTPTAAEAEAALDRPKQNLPLFLDRPAVTAENSPKAEPEPKVSPPQVVVVQPKLAQGNANLTLPANPAELTPTPPLPLATAAGPD